MMHESKKLSVLIMCFMLTGSVMYVGEIDATDNNAVHKWEDWNANFTLNNPYYSIMDNVTTYADNTELFINSSSYTYIAPVFLYYYKPIQLTGINGTLTNHTVMLNITHEANMQADFSDINLNLTDGTQLGFEFRNITADNAIIYVRIPALTNNYNITLTYGDGSAWNNNTPNTWSPEYKVVANYKEGVGRATTESTKNGNNGVIASGVAWVADQYGYNIDMVGTAGYNITYPDINVPAFSGGYTMQAMIYNDQNNGANTYILSGQTPATTDGYFMFAQPNPAIQCFHYINPSTFCTCGNDNYNLNEWSLVGCQWNTTHLNNYINGTLVRSCLCASGIGSDSNLLVGNRQATPAQTYNGWYDFVRISEGALTNDEINYTYHNIHNHYDYTEYGNEVSMYTDSGNTQNLVNIYVNGNITAYAYYGVDTSIHAFDDYEDTKLVSSIKQVSDDSRNIKYFDVPDEVKELKDGVKLINYGKMIGLITGTLKEIIQRIETNEKTLSGVLFNQINVQRTIFNICNNAPDLCEEHIVLVGDTEPLNETNITEGKP